MIWLTWRQHRIEALIGGLILFLIATILVITNTHITSTYQAMGLATCASQYVSCQTKEVAFQSYIVNTVFGSQTLYLGFVILLLTLPLLAGIFVGAQLITREIEQGTYRLVWTQGVTWSRWFLVKVSILAGLILCAFALLSVLLNWWLQPLLATTQNIWVLYDVRDTVPLCYGLFAFTLGVTAGALIKKTVPAMAVTLTVFIVIRIAIELLWRPYFLPPVTLTWSYDANPNLPRQAWIISEDLIDRQGNPVPNDAPQVCNNTTDNQPPSSQQFDTCMKSQGFQNRIVYQPADRLWLFQGIESGFYLVISGCLLIIAVWLMKRQVL
jgi:hypothetical protein